MGDTDWKLVAARLNAHLADRRLSSHDVAAKAGVDRKTVDRLRAGRAVRLQTLQWVEQALRVPLLQPLAEPGPEVAPVAAGGYRRDAVAPLVGSYQCYRRSFDRPAQLIASHVQVAWDEVAHCLRFSEHQRNRTASGKAYEYHFNGDVHVPPNLGIVHFVVRSGDGRVRLMTTAMPREQEGTLLLKGFLLTLNEIADIGYYPVTSPIVLARQPAGGPTPDPALATGVVGAGHPKYAWARALLSDTERKFLPHDRDG